MDHVTQPAALLSGGKVLHIGYPKTGTTALQSALHLSRSELEAQGTRNAAPQRSRHPHAGARFATGKPLAHKVDKGGPEWDRVARRFRSSTARTTILSSEALYRAPQDQVRAIVDDLGGDVQVVATMRAFASQLRSRWQQSFLSGGQRTFDDWATSRLSDQEWLYRNGPQHVIDSWGPVVGEERILFMISDLQDRDLLFRRFETLLGLTEKTLRAPTIDNAALSATGSEFLRQLNSIDPSRRSDPTSVRADILRRGARRVQRDPGLSRDRVRVPKWAAERANEIAQDWVGQLQASSTVVVGRLKDLVIDVDRLPEQHVTPQQIDISEAAYYTQQFYQGAMAHYEAAAQTEAPRPVAPGPAAPRPEDLPARDLLALLRGRATRRLSGWPRR